jgi:hypothetical protein
LRPPGTPGSLRDPFGRVGIPVRRLIREPLLHFVAIGALLFGVYAWINRGAAAPDEIVVSRGQIEALRAQFARTWQRDPTVAELDGLIDGWVRDEILYREGRALGFDADDPVIRRRVAQKVEFLADELTPVAPTDADLQAWLDNHAENYRIEPRFTFQQIYFDPSRRRERLDADVATAQRALTAGRSVSGDATLLPRALENVARAEVVRTFGEDFAAALDDLAIDEWSAPLESGYGVHLVRVTAREDGRAATLEEARAAVERDLLHEQTQQGRQRFYAALLDKYVVRIEADE